MFYPMKIKKPTIHIISIISTTRQNSLNTEDMTEKDSSSRELKGLLGKELVVLLLGKELVVLLLGEITRAVCNCRSSPF
jgi:hypothetical protein